jgi:hypothetical protein
VIYQLFVSIFKLYADLLSKKNSCPSLNRLNKHNIIRKNLSNSDDSSTSSTSSECTTSCSVNDKKKKKDCCNNSNIITTTLPHVSKKDDITKDNKDDNKETDYLFKKLKQLEKFVKEDINASTD